MSQKEVPGLPDGFWYVGQYNSYGYKWAIVVNDQQLRFINKEDYSSVQQWLTAANIKFSIYQLLPSWQKVYSDDD